MIKKLPLYILVDGSGSMFGEASASLKNFLDSIFSKIKNDANLYESIDVCLSIYGEKLETIKQLSRIEDIGIHHADIDISEMESNFGMGLSYILSEVVRLDDEKYISPMLMVITDGYPSDLSLYDEAVQIINSNKFSSIVVCLSGQHCDDLFVKLLTDNIYYLDDLDASSFIGILEGVCYECQEASSDSNLIEIDE